jgi:hypothetical protein
MFKTDYIVHKISKCMDNIIIHCLILRYYSDEMTSRFSGYPNIWRHSFERNFFSKKSSLKFLDKIYYHINYTKLIYFRIRLVKSFSRQIFLMNYLKVFTVLGRNQSVYVLGFNFGSESKETITYLTMLSSIVHFNRFHFKISPSSFLRTVITKEEKSSNVHFIWRLSNKKCGKEFGSLHFLFFLRLLSH